MPQLPLSSCNLLLACSVLLFRVLQRHGRRVDRRTHTGLFKIHHRILLPDRSCTAPGLMQTSHRSTQGAPHEDKVKALASNIIESLTAKRYGASKEKSDKFQLLKVASPQQAQPRFKAPCADLLAPEYQMRRRLSSLNWAQEVRRRLGATWLVQPES